MGQKQDLTKTNIGNTGEALVTQYLVAQGWQILDRQWRCRWGEIDIIAQQGSCITFVEVKTRQKHSWDDQGREALSRLKQHKLTQTAQVYLSQVNQGKDYTYRFDVALVERSGSTYRLIDYLQAAFDALDP
jgi:putative endonuclease